jgi:nucleoid DNA-binding protein
VNKSELIKEVANRAGVSIREAKNIVEATLEVISEHLQSGEDVKLIGFGTFATKKRAPRTGVNPRTGQRIEIKSRTVPVFSPGAQLKAMANVEDPEKTDDPGEFIKKGEK